MKMTRRFIIGITSAMILAGCATNDYVERKTNIFGNHTIGHYSSYVQEGVYKVGYKGTGDVHRAEDFALMKSAETTIENGYRYFIVDEKTYVNNEHTTRSPGSFYEYKGKSYYSSGYSSTKTLPEFYFMIKCYLDEESYLGDKTLYTAANVIRNITIKYEMKEDDGEVKESIPNPVPVAEEAPHALRQGRNKEARSESSGGKTNLSKKEVEDLESYFD